MNLNDYNYVNTIPNRLYPGALSPAVVARRNKDEPIELLLHTHVLDDEEVMDLAAALVRAVHG